jgi:hypothetical protein
MNNITSAVDRIAVADVSTVPRLCGLRSVLGFAAWTRLPEAVRARFGDPPAAVDGERSKVRLPALLSPGTTHVEHFDEAGGWFRFTMTVTHPFFGEMFYQTGRFRAAGEQL